MTDRIDLDDLETEEPKEEQPNRGDWFWRGEGDPEDEPPRADDESDSLDADETDGGETERTSNRVPHVPRETKDRPVGIPKASGGAGAGVTDRPDGMPKEGTEASPPAGETTGEAIEASGPHGGDADDMTLAVTYRATRRLADPTYAFSDASAWSDWLGIVGDVPAHAITKFQREHGVDADFFNGSGMGPRERLADIDERSMFYAKRFVLVGCENEAEWAPSGWEFLPLEEAAEKAGWDLE